MKYCESIYQTQRRQTRVVMVGNVGVGGNNPIRTQSMTTCSTRDVEATIEQAIRLADAGCEIVRVTVQGMKEAEACEGIKNGLIQKGYDIPLVADIHFYPPAAMKVVDFVDKVRVNPGNFVDKRASFKVIEYDDTTYAAELVKIEEKFAPLVLKCKQLKRSMRIGTNHGSLSDRIMNRYGDTPQGMVESAVEFTDVCRKYDYHDIIFSMKASNPQVMIQAYRLLVARMYELGWDYPLHLGVTEAGQGEDGRIKSAMGIGSLLFDGIGDTIRVSLTEDPWYEIDPCDRLVRLAHKWEGHGIAPFEEKHRNVERIERRSISFPKNVAMHRDGTVIVSVSEDDLKHPDLFKWLGCEGQLGRPKLKGATADMIALAEAPKDPQAVSRLKMLQEIGVGVISPVSINGGIRILSVQQALEEKQRNDQVSRFQISFAKEESPYAIEIDDVTDSILQLKPALILFHPSESNVHSARKLFEMLKENGLTVPIILKFSYDLEYDDLIMKSSAEIGALLCDGLGEGVWIESNQPIDSLRNLSFNILQSARMRTFKTDFISCPSCGRTLFDLQDVTKRIRSRTAHLPGVKIAIMGCIVNGPGEMADADFGYVGSKPGKIDLYVGKSCVEKDIDFSDADDRLIALIKQHGRWKDASSEE